MKNFYVFFVLLFISLFYNCKKDLPSNAYKETGNIASAAEQANSIFKTPIIDYKSSDPSQYITPSGRKNFSDFTLKLSTRKAGITIVSLTFVAYGDNNLEARSIQLAQDLTHTPSLFYQTASYPPAKAIAQINHTSLKLPDNGSKLSVKFHVTYNLSLFSRNSGDTVSLQLIAVKYVDQLSPDDTLSADLVSPLTPSMMVVASKLGISVRPETDSLQGGLVKIFNLSLSCDAYGPFDGVSLDNIPLIIESNNVMMNDQLEVRDYYNHVVSSNTTRQNNKYTIHLDGFGVSSGDPDLVAALYVYANVTSVAGSAYLSTYLQKPVKLAWRDSFTTLYTIQNAKYFLDYPTDVVITHN